VSQPPELDPGYADPTIRDVPVFPAAIRAHAPLFTRTFVIAALANAALSLAGFLFVHLPGFLQQLGAGEARIGRIMAAQALGAILAWPVVGHVMDARGRRMVILAGVALFVTVIAMYLSIDALGPLVYAVRLLDGVSAMMACRVLFPWGSVRRSATSFSLTRATVSCSWVLSSSV
jgi:MFS family permease